jgi:hypothetical protein
MFATIWEELGGRGAGTVAGLILGGAVTWALARWHRRREWQKILQGDARDTVVIHQHVIETEEFPDPADASRKRRMPTVLRIRSLGQGNLKFVVPNLHLGDVLLHRARQVTSRQTLISMEGGEGSYLLETLTGYVCDRVCNAPFEHDLYVMAPCCEPKELAHHQPITVLLIAAADLPLFEKWTDCRDVQVEHGADGARVLTPMALAQRHRVEQQKIAEFRQQGQRTKYLETMYVLDLPLDRRTAKLPTKKVPWGRFEAVLKQLNLDERPA